MANSDYSEEVDRKNTKIRLMLLREELAFVQGQIDQEILAFEIRRQRNNDTID